MQRRRLNDLLALLIGPTLALISFVLAYYVDPLGFGQRNALAALPAFLLSVIILLISQEVITRGEIMRASAISDKVYEAVQNYLHIIRIGSPERALQYVSGRLSSLEEVRNTSFNLLDEMDKSEEKLYQSPAYAELQRKLIERTGKGLRWKDVGDRRADERLHELASRYRHHGPGVARYQYRILDRDEPQINFIILSYPNGDEEVLFNWDYREIGQDPKVLLSRDRDVVEMFAVQFEFLWRAANGTPQARSQGA